MTGLQKLTEYSTDICFEEENRDWLSNVTLLNYFSSLQLTVLILNLKRQEKNNPSENTISTLFRLIIKC